MAQGHYRYDDSDILFHYSLDLKPDPNDGEFKMHTHSFCELYYIISGKGVFNVEGTSYPLKSGSILIMRQAEAHALYISPDEPYERLALKFDPEIIRSAGLGELLLPFENRELGKKNLYTPSDFSTPLYSMLLEGVMKKSENPRVTILSMLIPLLNEIKAASERKKDSGEAGEALSWQIIDYVNRHLADDLSLELICKRFYISKPQLCRIFKATAGSTVWEYITIKRLMLSQKLMKEGLPPTRVYAMCGFKDYSVFYRAYKKRFGICPKSPADMRITE